MWALLPNSSAAGLLFLRVNDHTGQMPYNLFCIFFLPRARPWPLCIQSEVRSATWGAGRIEEKIFTPSPQSLLQVVLSLVGVAPKTLCCLFYCLFGFCFSPSRCLSSPQFGCVCLCVFVLVCMCVSALCAGVFVLIDMCVRVCLYFVACV